MRGHLKSKKLLLAGVVPALLAAACGGADANEASSSEEGSSPGGCGQPGFSSLEPQPLEEPTEVVISAAGKIEAFAPGFLALANGEFEKENLEVEFVTLQTSVQALATREVDAALTAPSIEMVNAVNQGVDLKWVAGNYYPEPDSQIGIYARTDLVGEDRDFSELAGEKVSLTNPGGLTLVTLANRLAEHDLSLDDVSVERMAPADALIALENGALGAAWLNAPLHLEVADRPGYVFVGGQDPDDVGGGLVVGPKLLEGGGNCEVITALLRAMERTIQTSLKPGYKDDPEAMAQLAEVLEIPEESLAGNEELIFTQRIPENTMTEFQDALVEFGMMEEGDRVAEEDLVDLSYLEGIDGAG